MGLGTETPQWPLRFRFPAAPAAPACVHACHSCSGLATPSPTLNPKPKPKTLVSALFFSLATAHMEKSSRSGPYCARSTTCHAAVPATSGPRPPCACMHAHAQSQHRGRARFAYSGPSMRVCVRARVVRSPPHSTDDLFLGDDDVFAPLLADLVEDAGHHPRAMCSS